MQSVTQTSSSFLFPSPHLAQQLPPHFSDSHHEVRLRKKKQTNKALSINSASSLCNTSEMHLSVSVCATDYCLTRLLACFTILLIRYQQSPPGSVVVTAAISQINSPDQPSKTSAERFTFIYISNVTSSDCCVQTKGTVFKITVVYLFISY